MPGGTWMTQVQAWVWVRIFVTACSDLHRSSGTLLPLENRRWLAYCTQPDRSIQPRLFHGTQGRREVSHLPGMDLAPKEPG